jgi:protocatechuate 3,4-dioxygenase, beta subunit
MSSITTSILLLFLIIAQGCNAQVNNGDVRKSVKTTDAGKRIGGPCDGCEIMYVGMPEVIPAIDTSSGWNEEGQKLLIKGKVVKTDGKTPAPGVVLYYWQTDNRGLYTSKTGMPEEAKRHGHIRGWIKSDDQGNYALYTIRPAAYPNENAHAHIHLLVREPGLSNEYYIDEFVFDDDPLLTNDRRSAAQNRGGSGILKTVKSGDLQVAEHKIILGLNIPGYPGK